MKIDVGELEGGATLVAWCEKPPAFHDAALSRLDIHQGAESVLVAHIFRMGTEVDDKGYYVQTKHAAVTFTLSELIEVELYDFMEAGVMSGLDIERDAEGFTLTFGSSYGVHGRIKAKQVAVSFVPEPAPPA